MQNTADEKRKDVLTAFVKQFYNNAHFIPKQIIIAEEINDKKIIETWLGRKKDARVYLLVPKRGEKKKLAEMVAENARIYLDQIENKAEREKLKNTQALEKLQKYLNLKDIPKRIEAFDISNTQGAQSVASMVVFENGQRKRMTMEI